MSEPGDRLLHSLPAIYRAADRTRQLRALLAAYEAILLHSDDPKMLSIAQQIDAIPALFAPLGLDATEHAHERTPDRFVAWLAHCVAFTPYPHVPADRLRHVIARIVPLYGRRGTRGYMRALIRLCFDGVTYVAIDENPAHGFTIGRARLGLDTLLTEELPARFRIEVRLDETGGDGAREPLQSLERRVRALVDFAKPAHTAYELVLKRGKANAQETAH
jgi:hypothetical protein